MRWPLLGPIVGLFFCAGILGCGSEEPQDDPLVAKVGRREMRESDLEARLKAMSGLARAQYEGEDGRRTLLDKMIQEEVFFQAADRAGYENDPDVVEEVDRVRRNAMLRAYYRREIREKAKPSAAEVEEYYRSHIEEFRAQPRVRVRHVMTETEAEAERVRGLAEMGRDFSQLAENYSKDERTSDAGGLIPGYLSPGHKVPYLGDAPNLVSAAVRLSEGEISPVVKTGMGYHVLKAEEVYPGALLALDDVRPQIEQRETDRRAAEMYDLMFLDLSEQLNVQQFGEQYRTKTVEELFEEAQKVSSPKDRIRLYERVLETYPDDPRAYEAQFMIGFTYSEELGNYARARIAFATVVAKYPDCDLCDSAKWMLENLGKGDVSLDEIDLPEGAVGSEAGAQ